MYKTLIICLAFFVLASVVKAADQLLYFEAQGIAGYSSQVRKPIYYSMNPDAEMQKPSMGFDYLSGFPVIPENWPPLLSRVASH